MSLLNKLTSLIGTVRQIFRHVPATARTRSGRNQELELHLGFPPGCHVLGTSSCTSQGTRQPKVTALGWNATGFAASASWTWVACAQLCPLPLTLAQCICQQEAGLEVEDQGLKPNILLQDAVVPNVPNAPLWAVLIQLLFASSMNNSKRSVNLLGCLNASQINSENKILKIFPLTCALLKKEGWLPMLPFCT